MADPGLVLVRGLICSGFRDERKGWNMTVKLTDAQLVMLSAASQRESLCSTAPAKMKGAVLSKVSEKLVKLGLVREVRAKAGMPFWRREETGQSYTLKLTAAGLKAIAVDDGSEEAIKRSKAMQSQPPLEETDVSRPEAVGEHAKTLTPRAGSKLARVIDLLQRSHGTTISNLIEATGWLPHTTQAALTGLRKRGYAVVREQTGGGDLIYRVAGPATPGSSLCRPDGSGGQPRPRCQAEGEPHGVIGRLACQLRPGRRRSGRQRQRRRLRIRSMRRYSRLWRASRVKTLNGLRRQWRAHLGGDARRTDLRHRLAASYSPRCAHRPAKRGYDVRLVRGGSETASVYHLTTPAAGGAR